MNRLVTTRSDIRIRPRINLGRILISDLVANLFMHSLLGIILLYLAALFYTEGVLHKVSSLL